MKANDGCGCKGPYIRSHGIRKRQVGQSYFRPSLPQESPVLTLQDAEWAEGPVWTCRSDEKPLPFRLQGTNPGRPDRSQAFCSLGYLAHNIKLSDDISLIVYNKELEAFAYAKQHLILENKLYISMLLMQVVWKTNVSLTNQM